MVRNSMGTCTMVRMMRGTRGRGSRGFLPIQVVQPNQRLVVPAPSIQSFYSTSREEQSSTVYCLLRGSCSECVCVCMSYTGWEFCGVHAIVNYFCTVESFLVYHPCKTSFAKTRLVCSLSCLLFSCTFVWHSCPFLPHRGLL